MSESLLTPTVAPHPSEPFQSVDSVGHIPQDVYLFGTCVLDLFMPEAGMDVVTLLSSLGIRVHYPQGQSCCGQPAYTSGHPNEAFAVARAQLDLFNEPWPIIVPSGSCGGMMKHHWPRLFANSEYAAQAEAISARVFEFSRFLVDVLHYTPQDIGAPTQVAVHTSCGARREMNVHTASWQLVDQLSQVERVVHERESECCGFGGTFSLKHPDISGAMVSDKVAALKATQATEIISADAGCMLNIGGKIGKSEPSMPRPKHLATFLVERTGLKSTPGGAYD